MAEYIYSYTGSIVTFTATVAGTYDITAFGAQGGNSLGGGTGGNGAEIGGDFTLAAGEQLEILVGSEGSDGTNPLIASEGGVGGGGGGGGGSFVIETFDGSSSVSNILAIAGGGGGGNGISAANGSSGGTATGTGSSGGSAGNPYGGGGGGGYSGNGADGGSNFLFVQGGRGGKSFLAGGAGGAGGSSEAPAIGGNGGFGGGGGGGTNYGGGGGYSGGNTGSSASGGGGGGSKDNGTNQVLVAGENTGNGLVTITLISCFLEGTLIEAGNREIAVEDIKAGDLVTVLENGLPILKPVKWVGQRSVRSADLPADDAHPVRIRAHAFAEDMPRRDLLVTPEHCLFVDGKLIPARMLVNGSSIIVDRGISAFTFYHIEMDRHGILLAEGLPAESYLDTGNRGNFANADAVAMRPDLTVNVTHKSWAVDAYVPARPGRRIRSVPSSTTAAGSA